jgi:hypothetical protein
MRETEDPAPALLVGSDPYLVQVKKSDPLEEVHYLLVQVDDGYITGILEMVAVA